MKHLPVDHGLYEYVPTFGSAGGPLELRLTQLGRTRVFCVANNIQLDCAEYDALVTTAAAGTRGWCPMSGSAYVAFRKLLTFADGRYVVTEAGTQALARADEEEARVIERLKGE